MEQTGECIFSCRVGTAGDYIAEYFKYFLFTIFRHKIQRQLVGGIRSKIKNADTRKRTVAELNLTLALSKLFTVLVCSYGCSCAQTLERTQLLSIALQGGEGRGKGSYGNAIRLEQLECAAVGALFR